MIYPKNLLLRLLPVSFFFLSLLVAAQQDSVAGIPGITVEEFYMEAFAEEAANTEHLLEAADLLQTIPGIDPDEKIDLNRAGRQELALFPFLTEAQVLAILHHRSEFGPFLAMEELQSVEGLDPATIRWLLPYCKLSSGLDDLHIPFHQVLFKGKNTLYFRWGRTLERSRGFLPAPETRQTKFEGSPDKLFLSWRHQYSNRLSYGVTMERDAGEAFFRGSNPQGFDYQGFHFFVKDYSETLKTIALGDFTISLGQGLLRHGGFGGRKSAQVMQIKKGGPVLRPHRSPAEAGALKGAGIEVAWAKHWSAAVFGSNRKVDANLTGDTMFLQQTKPVFSSIPASGLHRTAAEIADEKQILHRQAGATLRYEASRRRINLNGLWEGFNGFMEPPEAPHNLYRFSGRTWWGVSLDYAWMFRNFHIFGELARGNNGAIAGVHGLIFVPAPSVDLALLVRHLPARYQAPDPSVFAETSQGNNETGIYLGVVIRPDKYWKWSTFWDLYRHPWLRFRSDAPSEGFELRSRITYSVKRLLEVYLEGRWEEKAVNASSENKLNALARNRYWQGRVHFSLQLNKALEIRTRFNAGLQKFQGEAIAGFQAHQDILFRPMEFPLSFTARFSIFDTEDYAVRFYNYENGLLLGSSVPAYYSRGFRYYGNFRFKGIRGVVLEARLARSFFSQLPEIGSGDDAILGNTKTEISVQIKLSL